MTSDAPNPPEQLREPGAGTPAARPDDAFAAALRGFGPLGIGAMAAIVLLGPVLEPLGAILALLWAHRSRTPWRAIGLARPRSWPRTVAIGVLAGAAFKLAMKALVMPLLGAPAINPVYHFLEGNTAALPGMLFDVTVGAGFGEEVVFRGFLFERLGRLLGSGPRAKVAIVLVTALWFGALHYPGQGLAGAEQALVTGLAFGSVFAATGRLWPLVFAHAAFDLTAVAIIYWGVEARVAHLVFR